MNDLQTTTTEDLPYGDVNDFDNIPSQSVNMTIVCGEKNDDVVIDESNFTEYFFDVRQHEPREGQVMARFVAIAEFIDGAMKRDVLYLLRECKNGAESAQRVMRKLGGATEKDSYRVLIEICEDLMNGMSYDEVMNKPYRYQCEMFYYTNLENVPENDPHWSVIKIAKLPAKT